MLIKICHNARFTNSKKALTPIESKDSEFTWIYSKALYYNKKLPSLEKWLFHLKYNELSLLKCSWINYKNYCLISGRSKAVYKRFKMSWIILKEKNAAGSIPGLRKSTW